MIPECIFVPRLKFTMEDSYKHKGLRNLLVKELRVKKINNEMVLNAIGIVPRHLFMDDAFLAYAYKDQAFPIDAGQTISQPYTVAYQTELLEVIKNDKILEIGTGSGYQTCVLLELGARVFTVERQKVLFTKANQTFKKLGYNPKTYFGDGYKGLPAFAPFNKILVTAGAQLIPEQLLSQLVIGGMLVIPVGERDSQTMTRIIRLSEREYKTEKYAQFRFVPLLENKTK